MAINVQDDVLGTVSFPDGTPENVITSSIQDARDRTQQVQRESETTGVAENVLRQAQLAERAAINPTTIGGAIGAGIGAIAGGVGAVPGAAAGALAGNLTDLAIQAYNAYADKAGAGKAISFTDFLDNVKNSMGLPKPVTPQERIVERGIEAVSGIGAPIAAGQMMARSAIPAVKTVGGILAAEPMAQVVPTILGAGAGAGVSELGGGKGEQALAEIGASLGPSAVGAGARGLRYALAGGKAPQEVAANIAKFAEAGVPISYGQATRAGLPQYVERAIEKIPLSSTEYKKFGEAQQKAVGSKVEEIRKSISKATEPSTAGRAMQRGFEAPSAPLELPSGGKLAGLQGGLSKRAQVTNERLYSNIEKLIPQQKPIAPDNTVALLNELGQATPGMEKIQGSKLLKKPIMVDFKNRYMSQLKGNIQDPIQVYRGGAPDIKSGRPLYVSTSRKEAGLYAGGKMAQGMEEKAPLSSFVIDKSKIATEEQAREILKGMKIDEGNNVLSELIDPMLSEGTLNMYIGDRNVKKLFSELRKQGYQGIGFSDAGIKSRTANNIVLFDPKKSLEDASKYGKTTFQVLKKMRTDIGEQLNKVSLQPNPEEAQIQALYGAISEDMKQAAMNESKEAYNAFLRANSYNRAYHERIARINSIIQQKNPEGAFRDAFSEIRAGGTKIGSILNSVPKEDQKEVVGAFIARMGKAPAGQQDVAGQTFDTTTFYRNWQNMNVDAKNKLFNRFGSQFRRDMDNIAGVINTISEQRGVLANPSGTTQTMVPPATLFGVMGSIAAGKFGFATGIVSTIALSSRASKLFTNPTFVNWLAKNIEIPTQGIPAAINNLNQLALDNEDSDMAQFAEELKKQAGK